MPSLDEKKGRETFDCRVYSNQALIKQDALSTCYLQETGIRWNRVIF